MPVRILYIYTHTYIHIYIDTCICMYVCVYICTHRWLRLVGSLKLFVSFAKEPYKRDDILQKRPIILRSLLFVATPIPVRILHTCTHIYTHTHTHIYIFIYTYIHIYIYVCVYIYICVYI